MSITSECHLPPVESILDVMNFDMISSSHNGMGCQIVLQGLFDIVHQPSMFEAKLSYSDFGHHS